MNSRLCVCGLCLQGDPGDPGPEGLAGPAGLPGARVSSRFSASTI